MGAAVVCEQPTFRATSLLSNKIINAHALIISDSYKNKQGKNEMVNVTTLVKQ